MQLVKDFLSEKGFTDIRVFSYQSRYSEAEYLEYLQNSKFGVWVGAHESQGFALQEALSCDVLLLVWNIRTMSDEYGSNYHPYEATTIPYWSPSCGEYFYDAKELRTTFQRFINRLEYYMPRNFVVENLAIDKCASRFKDLIELGFNVFRSIFCERL